MSIWIKLDANLPDHPKVIHLRERAGNRADAAELGWYRLLMAAKRYGRWTFASEAHLRHVAGRYAAFLEMYREVGLLDDLTIHDGEEFNAPLDPKGAERQRRFRERHRNEDNAVTDRYTVTDRVEQSRVEQKEQTEARDAADIYWQLTGRYPTEKALAWIDSLTEQYGPEPTIRAMATAHLADRDSMTLLGRTQDLLAADARKLNLKEREAEKQRLAEKRAQPRVEETWRAEFRAAIERQYEEHAA